MSQYPLVRAQLLGVAGRDPEFVAQAKAKLSGTWTGIGWQLSNINMAKPKGVELFVEFRDFT